MLKNTNRAILMISAIITDIKQLTVQDLFVCCCYLKKKIAINSLQEVENRNATALAVKDVKALTAVWSLIYEHEYQVFK